MRIGFTGTRKGMTPLQRQAVAELLIELTHPHSNDEFHHGACIGADVDAHRLALEVTQARIYVHPSTAKTRVFGLKGAFHYFPPKPPLVRDKDIVANSEVLIATPHGFKELRSSGTWSTVRLARKAGIPIYIVWPDGHSNCERWHWVDDDVKAMPTAEDARKFEGTE